MISRTPSGFVVRDLNSALGTAVNGELIGSQFRTDIAELRLGQNESRQAAAGADFAFRALVR